MFVLNVYFCCELRFVATYAPNSDFYLEIQELTQILLRILRKNLAAEVSGLAKCLIKLNLRNVQEYFAITWNSNTTEIN